MNPEPIGRKQLKLINDGLYNLAAAQPLIELLRRAGEDVSDLETMAEHMKNNLTEYKLHVEGKK